MPVPYRVVIADDQLIARGYMEYYVRATKSFTVDAVLPSAQEALTYCRSHHPDLLILDIMMKQGIDGLSAAELLKRECPDIKIILTTSLAEETWLQKARASGVDSFWFKESAQVSLQSIMERTMAGESVYEDSAPAVTLGEITTDALSPKQKELLRHLTAGLSDKEIGDKMGIDATTVRTHLERIMRKTGIHSRTELAVKAGRMGVAVSDTERLGSTANG